MMIKTGQVAPGETRCTYCGKPSITISADGCALCADCLETPKQAATVADTTLKERRDKDVPWHRHQS